MTGASRGIGRAVALGPWQHRIFMFSYWLKLKAGSKDVYDEIVSAGGEATGVPYGY